MRHLVIGVFFRKRDSWWLGAPTTTPWLAASVATLRNSMFYGVIGPVEGKANALAGNMKDHLGESTLSDVQVSETEFRFTKRYAHHQDTIRYVFRKQKDGTWAGEFSGSNSGCGKVKCVLLAVPDEFFSSKHHSQTVRKLESRPRLQGDGRAAPSG
ncbi:MAG: hypothetical protein AAB686_02365 [Patescibacteria group bacterium]